MLPADDEIERLLPDSFVLFKPKDIVSGDFYWVAPLQLPPKVESANVLKTHHNPSDKSDVVPKVSPLRRDGRGAVLWAAADCTGHGVPGALMSMMINAFLNEAVKEKSISQPNEILYDVRKSIIASLKQKGMEGEQKDGMDAALCSLEYTGDNTAVLKYAGAYNSLWITRKDAKGDDIYEKAVPFFQDEGETDAYCGVEVKADKQPVGFLTGEQPPFTNHVIQLQKGDTIYIFSDGYEDQFGGPRDKKFKTKQFKEVLISIQDKTMQEQKERLDKTIEDWRGDEEQVDDILVFGVRV